MATYKQIQERAKARCGKTVKTCWIAHVKELNGLKRRAAPNRISTTKRVHPCPDWARPHIEAVMREAGMLG